MNKIIRTLIILVVTTIGCSKGTDSNLAKEPYTLVQWMNAEPKTLNLLTSRDVYGSAVNDYVYDALITRNKKTLQYEPELAEKMPEISEDGLVYTFNLRKGAKWHDGTPLTAHDFKFSFDMMMDKNVDSQHLKNYYEMVDKMEILDDYTIKFYNKKKYFLTLEQLGSMSPLPRHLFKDMKNTADFNTHDIGRNPLGTGPYKFDKWESGQKIVLVRNDEYWGKKPAIKKIIFKLITDPTAALQALRRGELDMMGLIPIQYEKEVKSDKNIDKEYQLLKYYRPGYSYIGWNNTHKIFSDKQVRLAMSHLVDVKLIIDKINYGYGTRVTGGFYFQSDQYNKDLKPVPYNPEKAKEILASAGWKDTDGDGILDKVLDKDVEQFKFEFLIPSTNPTAEKIVSVVQQEVKKVGIIMDIRRLEWATFEEMLSQRQFTVVMLGWSWTAVQQDPYQVWHSSQGGERGSNYIGYKNSEADKLMETAREELDEKKRNEMFHKLHEIIYNDQPYTFLYNGESLLLVHRRFKNVEIYKMGQAPRPGIEWTVDEKYNQ